MQESKNRLKLLQESNVPWGAALARPLAVVSIDLDCNQVEPVGFMQLKADETCFVVRGQHSEWFAVGSAKCRCFGITRMNLVPAFSVDRDLDGQRACALGKGKRLKTRISS